MNLLVTYKPYWKPSHLEFFRANSGSCTIIEDERIPLADQGIDPSKFDTIICVGLFRHNNIEYFTNLKKIQFMNAGCEDAPLEYMQEHGIEFHNARGIYSIPISEFVISRILESYRNLKFFNANQQKHVWEKYRNNLELHGKTVAIVGCGSIGSACARLFKAFDCQVLGLNKSTQAREYFDEIYPIADRLEILPQADIVLISCPLTRDTENLFSAEEFAAMKESVLVVNICRGKVVDQDALTCALESKQIAGAILDVFAEEPLPPDSPLWDMPNVSISPHNSFDGQHNSDRMFELCKMNVFD